MDNKGNINRFEISSEGSRKRAHTTSGTIIHKTELIIRFIISLAFVVIGILLIIAALLTQEMPELEALIYQLINEIVGIGLAALIYYFYLKAKVRSTFLRIIITVAIYFAVIWLADNLGGTFVLILQILTGLFGLLTSFVLFLNVITRNR